MMILYNQQFQIIVKLRNSLECINYMGINEPNINELPSLLYGYLLVDYIYLENEERNLFKQANHEYIIEQVQDMTDTVNLTTTRVNLIFEHPCKYLVWYVNLYKYFERHLYLVWPTDDNWENARQLFGKLIWLLSREGLCNTNNYLNIVYTTNYVNLGCSHRTTTCGSPIIKYLATKVNGLLLFSDNNNGVISSNAIPDNVILLTNNLTIQDISITIDELLNEASNEQIALANMYLVSVINIFNTGNNIDGSDNPIVNSSFLLNGKNRFQERDGKYYNYVQPYYYFSNTPADGINTYSFSLEPENVQPTGTINLGNINSKELILQFGKNNSISDAYLINARLRILTLSYTVLKIIDGQSYLVY